MLVSGVGQWRRVNVSAGLENIHSCDRIHALTHSVPAKTKCGVPRAPDHATQMKMYVCSAEPIHCVMLTYVRDVRAHQIGLHLHDIRKKFHTVPPSNQWIVENYWGVQMFWSDKCVFYI